MTHFISASCEGQVCHCGKTATHKLGEEIPDDEPCMTCGTTWRWDKPPPLTEVVPCDAFYHSTLTGIPRHNLTAYVCCGCFTETLGSGTGCGV